MAEQTGTGTSQQAGFSAKSLSYRQLGIFSVEVGHFWVCVNCNTVVAVPRESMLRNCRVCALLVQVDRLIANA